MKNYKIRVSLPKLEYPRYFLNFIRAVARQYVSVTFSDRRANIRKELAKFNGNIVYIPVRGDASSMSLYFANESAYSMFLLKYS